MGADRPARSGRLEPGPIREDEYIGTEVIRVRYSETDAQAVVYHGNYLVFFELGRTAWIRDAGFPYTGIEEEGMALVVAEAHARYLRSARYDDELVIETRLHEVRTRSCTFTYRICMSKDEAALVEGWTALVCLGPEGRAIALPGELAAAMRRRAAL